MGNFGHECIISTFFFCSNIKALISTLLDALIPYKKGKSRCHRLNLLDSLFLVSRWEERSEGIADGEVESKRVLERGHVVVAALAGVIRSVDANAEVTADDEHADVET